MRPVVADHVDNAEAGAVHHGYLVVPLASLLPAVDDLAYLSVDVALLEEPLRQRDVDLAADYALLLVVDHDLRPLEDIRVELLLTLCVGTEGVDVGPWLHPFVLRDWSSRRGRGTDDVETLDRLSGGTDRFDFEAGRRR